MEWRDRLQTIAVTAAVTSAAWLAVGLFLYARQVGASPRAETQETVLPGRLVVPVEGVRRDQLSDTWGQSRENGARAHEAIDIMAPRGARVLAAAPGTGAKLFVSVRGGTT